MAPQDWWLRVAVPTVLAAMLLALRRYRRTPVGEWAVRIAALLGLAFLALALLATPIMLFAAFAANQPGRGERILSAGLAPLAMAALLAAFWLAKNHFRKRR